MHVGQQCHAIHIDAAIAGRFGIIAERQQVAAVDGFVKKDGRDNRDDDQNQRGGREMKHIRAVAEDRQVLRGDLSQALKAAPKPWDVSPVSPRAMPR